MRIDLIIESRNVFTGVGDVARPAAIAVAGDRIVAVGSREDVRAFALEANAGGGAPEVRDFGDALVVPGFHDSHLHFFHSAVYSSPLATMFLGESETDCVARMQAFAKDRPNGWLLAQGWREYRWNPPVLPSKRSLDEAFPTRPVALYSGDAHTLWLNSAALDELGLTRDSVPPAGGSYDRDETGELTGIVREAAAMELMPQIMGSFTDEEVADAYRGFFARLAENGVTSVCDTSLMAYPGLDFIRDDVHASLLERGELTARVHLFPTLLDDMSRFEDMRARYTGPCLQAPGFKQFFDGRVEPAYRLGDRTVRERARRRRLRPTHGGSRDHATLRACRSRTRLPRAHPRHRRCGHPCGARHLRRGAREFGPLPEGRRNCLEHLENFLPGDMKRLADLQVVAAVQPPHMTLDPGGPERDLGSERVPYMWPFRTLLDDNTVLAFGTDSPVVGVNSMDVLYSAVTRQDPGTHEPASGWLPGERIGMAEALRAYTQGSAASAGRRSELGTLEAGKLADIAVLDRNLLACDADDIQKTKVLATFMGGTCVFER